MENNSYYCATLVNIPKKDRDFLKSKSCMLTLSIGQPAHEDAKLRSTFATVNAYFQKCTFAVNDTLQRHTLAFTNPELSESELYDLSYKLGSEWLERNDLMIKQELKIPHRSIRWDDWLKTSRFKKDLETVRKLYINNLEYKAVVDEVVTEFIVRYRTRIPNLCPEKALNNSLRYLLEECACMLQWFDENCNYEIYPSIRNDAISKTFELLEPEKNKTLLLPAGLKFKKHIGQKPHADFDKLAIENIIKTSPGHIYWKNKHGVFIGCNLLQARSFGFNKVKSLLGKSDFDILDYEMALEIRKNDLQVMESGKTQIAEEKTVANGKNSIYISHKTPIKDSNGFAMGVLGVSIDITKQKKLEQDLVDKTDALTKALNTKKEFLSKVSHEIRTPLQGILGISTELSREWDKYSIEEIRKYVDMIASSGNRLLGYTKNILDLASYNSGQPQLYLTKNVNLAELAKTVIADTISLIKIENKNLDIILETNSTQPILIECDQTRVSEIFYNIINNAVKYSDQGVIVVKIEDIAEKIVVSISDCGVGIPDDEKLTVFDAFTQSTRTKCLSKGTGLGLAISKEIIILHRGKIWVDDNKPTGSVFTFVLPREQTLKMPTLKEAKSTKKIRVLIVDDEAACLFSLSMILENCGHEIATAQDGVQALNYIQKHYNKIDLIMLDMMMPHMHGLEVLKKIKSNHNCMNIPVVIHTGFPDSFEAKEALTVGAIDIIPKPCTKIAVENVVNAIFGN